jgi:ribosomal peptide maturation radical SAM protein 1
MTNTSKKSLAIALISTPWPLYNRPSIQLGTLKPYLQSACPGVQVDTQHVYLKLAAVIGYKLYHEISERTWLAESVYAALLYPERMDALEMLFQREAGSQSILRKTGLKKVAAQVKKTTDILVDSRRWETYMLAGFSVSLCQLTSSLYFIRRLKQRFPDLIIVIGGSTFSGTATPAFFEWFPEVDVVINGEGELPFSQLVGCLQKSPRLADIPPIKGLITPQTANTHPPGGFNQLQKIDGLPPPDYDEYFEILKSFGPGKEFFPVLPLETSRGCWWQKKKSSGRTSGCAFCNLNLQWQGYRCRTPARVVHEVDHLTGRYQVLALTIVDNVLPRKTSREVFVKLAGLKKDLRLFAEIRATTPWSELKAMRAAGMQEVQIGIEALCTPLLKKLHKGTRTIQNLEIMRNCEALGIVNNSNLILNFPGSDERDVAATLRNLEFALPYRPLKTVPFWLGLGSPVWQNPAAYGVKALSNHPNWSRLFPRKIFRSLPFMFQTYRGDQSYQRKIWRAVKRKVDRWQKAYAELHRSQMRSPILSYRDGRDFLIVRQRQYQSDPLNHRLVGTSRLIYLFCMQPRSLKRIRSRFPGFAEDKIVVFLKMMTDKKLMFEEEESYLSLAVPVNPGK